MSFAKTQFESFLENFSKAVTTAGRKKEDIQILPVSKGQGVELIQSFLSLEGFPQELAENYSDELALKQAQLPSVKWHYQGALQSRKFDEIFSSAAVIQSLSRPKELLALKKFIEKGTPKKEIEFFIQVNISSEGQKLGASRDEAKALLELVSKENLERNFLGFMGVAAELSELVSAKTVQEQFATLRKFREQVFPKAKLSMGMSADYHLALAEGADIVRVGSSLFGARNYSK